jgi:hypothetical protein
VKVNTENKRPWLCEFYEVIKDRANADDAAWNFDRGVVSGGTAVTRARNSCSADASGATLKGAD